VAATRDTSVHVQSTWDERPTSGWRWHAFGGFTQRARAHEFGIPAAVLDRISDGSVPAVIDEAAERTTRRLAGGVRLGPPSAASSRHQAEFGVEVDSASTSARDQFAGTVYELIDNVRERIWNYDTPSLESHRHAVTTSAYAADTVRVSPDKVVTEDFAASSSNVSTSSRMCRFRMSSIFVGLVARSAS